MKFFLLFLVIVSDITAIQAWRSFVIQLNTIECVNLSTVVQLNCSIRSFNVLPNKNSKDQLFLSVLFMEDVQKPTMDVLISTQRLNKADVVLVNTTDLDGCSFLENRNSFHILQIVRNEFEKYSEFPKQCPVPKSTHINIKNLTMDTEKFPPYLPETDFLVHVQLNDGKRKIFKLNVTGTVVSKNRGRKMRFANAKAMNVKNGRA